MSTNPRDSATSKWRSAPARGSGDFSAPDTTSGDVRVHPAGKPAQYFFGGLAQPKNTLAVGALGGAPVNLAFRQSFLAYSTGVPAYIGFIVSYVVCMAATWAVYLRPG